jgi:MFS family permease
MYQMLAVEIGSRESAGVSSGIAATLLQMGNFAMAPLFGYMADVTGSYTKSWGLLMLSQLLGIVLLGWLRTAPDDTHTRGRVPAGYGSGLESSFQLLMHAFLPACSGSSPPIWSIHCSKHA